MFRKLSLEEKLVVSFLLAAILPVLLQFVVSYRVIHMQYEEMQNERYNVVHQNLNSALENMQKQQILTNIDYSHWSDTYQSTLNRDHEWFEEMFNNIVSEKVGIDVIYVINNNKEVVYQHNPVDGFIQDSKNYIEIVRGGNEIGTLMRISDGLYLVSFTCIKDSEATGAIGGVLVFGQQVDARMLQNLPKSYHFNIDLIHNSNSIKSGSTLENFSELIQQDSKQLETHNNTRYYKINDYVGSTIALWQVVDTGNLIEEAIEKTHRSGVIIIGVVLILVTVFVVLLKNNIMKPIRNLRARVNQMRNISYDMDTGIDEIAALTEEFEAMSEEINYQTTEIKEQNKTLQYLVYRDDITGAYNKRFFRIKLQEEFEKAVAIGENLCLALVDIDYFNMYRELIDVQERNDALTVIFHTIKSYLRDDCYVCFDGTDEFRIILANSQYKETLDSISQITAEISKKRFINMEKLPTGKITVSSGVASYPKDADNIEKLYYAARDRLHRAKHHNQGNVGYFYSIFNDIKDDIHSDKKTLIYATKAFLAVIDAMDEYTYTHTEGVVKYASIIAEELGLDEKQKDDIRIGALLHDIGKLELGRELLNKKEKLTEEDIALIKQHPNFGVNMLKTLSHFEGIAEIVKYHHERYDGLGYPDGLIGRNIPLGARIVAVADSFDAMTTVRAYRKVHKSFKDAAQELNLCAGKQFDPDIVKVFVKYIEVNNYNFNVIE